MKPLQQIIDGLRGQASPAEHVLLGKFLDELRANGWVFVHKSQIEGPQPIEEVLHFPETQRMDS